MSKIKELYIKFRWLILFLLVVLIAGLILFLPKEKQEGVKQISDKYLAEKRGEIIDKAIEQRIEEVKKKKQDVAEVEKQVEEIERKRDEKIEKIEKSDLRGLSELMRDLGY